MQIEALAYQIIQIDILLQAEKLITQALSLLQSIKVHKASACTAARFCKADLTPHACWSPVEQLRSKNICTMQFQNAACIVADLHECFMFLASFGIADTGMKSFRL